MRFNVNKTGCVFIIIALLLITFASYRFYMSTNRLLFYHRLEDRLNDSAEKFFEKNKNEIPKDGYSSVSINRLVIDKYIKEPIDKEGNKTCTGRSYIYKEDGEYKYQSCITCGDFRNRYVSDSKYCVGTVDDNIFIEATSSNGKEYNSLLSFDNGEYINGEYVAFNFYLNNDDLDKYVIRSENNEMECSNVFSNSCSINLTMSGKYTVYAYSKDNVVIGEKEFSLKFDNSKPNFEISNNDASFSYSYNEDYYEYENNIINLKDNIGIKKVYYTLNDEIKDITDTLSIKENLKSGRYNLFVTAIDYSNNEYSVEIKDLKIYKSIKLIYPDGKEEYFSVITGDKYNNLPGDYDWYLDSKGVALITNNTKVKEGNSYSIYGFSK